MSNSTSSFFGDIKNRIKKEPGLNPLRLGLIKIMDYIENMSGADPKELEAIKQQMNNIVSEISKLKNEIDSLKKRVTKAEKAISNILKLMSGGE